MAETREQFRDRVAYVAHQGFNPDSTYDMKGWLDDARPEYVDEYAGAALAVYAEALRDIRAAIVQRGRSQGVPWLAAPDIDQFAAERGIDLEA